ncbi:kinetochore-associated protein KNL-2 homolog isoform X2 [Medicago truncatula]|uniref:kinetochore-associated protein KNL-2 homolog isoform X2 n=1 Tax=Medicago truncatula TaxID=3880 RepID=UPI000D2F3749|nr:kinetochore-associated protein KNL-2 homolog isoform X2 [Medicago truncatula]
MVDSTPPTSTISSNGTATSSCFRRTVTLYDWWLVKSSQGNNHRLAISGISSRKEEAVQFFVSAPIIKRYDVFSLETADGIYVITRGFMNEQRTLENGFTPQISKIFLYGFPPNWESYALECIGEGSEADIDSANAIPDNVSAICQEILSDGEENFSPTSLVLPDEALGKCKKPFATKECKASKEMSGIDVTYGSGENRHSTRLRNINVFQRKQQPAYRGPRKHPNKKQISTSTEVETCDSDTAISENVSANLPEIPSDAVEKSFPTSLVSPDKTIGDCNKAFLEDERDMSIKKCEVNVVHGSGRNRCSARLHNVKLCQKKRPVTGDPATHPDKDQISASPALEKSDGGLESLMTPIQSQKGIVNTLSGQVTDKFRSRIPKTFSSKTEGCYKRKRVTFETEAVGPKRKNIKPASSVKSSQGRDISHSNKGSTQRLSTVSPESLGLKKSRSGRWLLPRLEFWRNQTPIYNMVC